MIILFGSYARGQWVEDIYTEGHITYEYISDFDILVLTRLKKTAKDFPPITNSKASLGCLASMLWFAILAVAECGRVVVLKTLQLHHRIIRLQKSSWNIWLKE
jgi:hypothetical protein